MTELYLAATQSEVTVGYEFSTGIRVFSLEEALYHSLVYWQQSAEDFLSAPFIRWVESALGLGDIAVKLTEIAKIESFTMRYLAFLSVVDYLPKQEVAALQRTLTNWEKRSAWEKLAEQGDYWINRGDGERAYAFYTKAMARSDDAIASLLNNGGVALMHMGHYDAAAAHFAQALRLEPANARLCFNLIEAHIFAGDVVMAQNLIDRQMQQDVDHAELHYFRAEILMRSKRYFDAIKLYEKAIKTKYDPEYIYKLCDCYMKIRLYDKVLAAMGDVKVHDVSFYTKQGEYFAEMGNFPMAIKSIEQALAEQNHSAQLWTLLATYHRMDYNVDQAEQAISKAMALAPENPRALLEHARIVKARGRTKDYQAVLTRILERFKKDYREYVES